MVLHKLKHVGVGPVKEGNAACGDFSIDCSKPTKNDVVVHEQGVLTDPIPGRVEMPSLEDVEARLYSFNVSIAVLAVDTVELRLQCQTGGLFLIKGNLSCPRITPEVVQGVDRGRGGENGQTTSLMARRRR